jgi:hypothetical protein
MVATRVCIVKEFQTIAGSGNGERGKHGCAGSIANMSIANTKDPSGGGIDGKTGDGASRAEEIE